MNHLRIDTPQVEENVWGSDSPNKGNLNYSPYASPSGRLIKRTRYYTPPSSPIVDRFIPNRAIQDTEVARYKLFVSQFNEKDEIQGEEEEHKDVPDYSTSLYTNALEERLFDGASVRKSRILNFSDFSSPNSPKSKLTSCSTSEGSPRSKTTRRSISTTPERILDAPALIDDFYLNLMDWSGENQLAVALSESVYLFNAETGDINKLMSCQGSGNNVTSVSFTSDSNYLAIGTSQNDVQIWDLEKNIKLRSMRGHAARVGALSWNKEVLSSGSRDGKIMNHDVRISQHLLSTLDGHAQEVCGLKWSPDGTSLASGGNDNILNIWDSNVISGGGSSTRYSFNQHQAAVKALAWCPWQSNLLASGGGTADRKMMFWNTANGSLVNSIDTKSQVCALAWSKHDKELVSSHGFSQNQLCVWKYPTLTKVAELTGHTSRVLHLAQSPDGATIVSGAGDETLRFWKIFSPKPQCIGNNSMTQTKSVYPCMSIR
ncbi:anaphase-promoting complex subunit Cdc20/Cdh1 [Acrasis kona]|uniref:Anaphase-promoting complex subunit Cdc20/Cdh1 n=1 Tax=Acrasis kona TaxID=1008807 RepID=A0AAW2Z737_9EUKA